MQAEVTTRIDAGVMYVGINRPEKRNALTMAMYAALREALEAGEADPGVRALLIHGVPGCFTAGNDLADFQNDPPRDTSNPVFGFIHCLPRLQKPLVAAVDGAAVGIGTTLLLHCDLVFASPRARFMLPFTSLGLCPEAASSFLLPRLMGPQRAAELLLLGEPFGADEALRYGLVNALYDPQELLEQAEARARRLAELPSASVRATKALLRAGTAAAVASTLETEAREFLRRLESPEAAEAFAAFFERRKPDFSRYN